MPRFGLRARAACEGIASCSMREGTLIRTKFRCSTCGTETDDFAAVDPTNTEELAGSRGEVNHAQSCSGCSAQFNVSAVVTAAELSSDEFDPDGDGAEVMTLEIRGAEPIDFEASEDSFVAKGASGTSFDVDLTEGEWGDYDEGSDVALSMMEPTFEWGRATTGGKKKKGGKRK